MSKEKKKYSFNVLDFSLKLLIFSLILGILSASSDTHSERFLARMRRSRGRSSGHYKNGGGVKETSDAGVADVGGISNIAGL